MHYTDYSRIDYTDFLKEQEEKKIPMKLFKFIV